MEREIYPHCNIYQRTKARNGSERRARTHFLLTSRLVTRIEGGVDESRQWYSGCESRLNQQAGGGLGPFVLQRRRIH